MFFWKVEFVLKFFDEYCDLLLELCGWMGVYVVWSFGV